MQRLTTYIIVAHVPRYRRRVMCHELWPDPGTATAIAGYISLLTDIFLRLIKMIIAPLVFSTLVVGIAAHGRRQGGRAHRRQGAAWFVCASLVSLLLGMLLVNVLQPGANLNLPLPDAGAATNLKASSLTLKDFITHSCRQLVFDAMAQQRDPADRGVLDVLRRRARRARATGEDADRGAIDELSPRHAEDHRLRDAARAAGGVRRDGRDRSPTQGLGILRHLRQVHRRLLSRPGHPLVRAGRSPAAWSSAARVFGLIGADPGAFLLAFSTASYRGGLSEDPGALERFGVSRKISASCCRWATPSTSTAR